MKMWEVECSSCGKMVPANKCPQVKETALCKLCWLEERGHMFGIKRQSKK